MTVKGSGKKLRSQAVLNSDIHRLHQLGTGFWASATLFAALKLDLFNHLGEASYSSEAIARKLSTNRRWTEKLLLACTALGLTIRSGSQYRNSPLALKYLIEGRPHYQGALLKHLASFWNRFGSLASTVRTGKRNESEEPVLEAGSEWIQSSHNIAMSGYAENLARMVDFSERKRLCDIGGGIGTYAAVLCLHYPQMTAVVLEEAEVVSSARELIARIGLDKRIEVKSCRLLFDSYGTDYDAALLSGVLHGLSERNCKKVLAKAYNALQPGGMLVIQEMLMDEESEPLMPTLFSLNMTLGASYTGEEILAWVYEAGFVRASIEAIEGGLWLDHIITAYRV